MSFQANAEKRRGRLIAPALIAAVAVFAFIAGEARADLTGFDGFGVAQYVQTSDAAPTNPSSNFFASRIFFNTAGDVTSAVGSSNGHPLTFSSQSPTDYSASTSLLSSATLDSYIQPGTNLQVNVTGGNVGTQSAVVTYGPTLFSAVAPALTGTTYDSLQGLNPSIATTINFNSWAAVAGASESDSFVTISKVSDGSTVFDAGFLSNSASSVILAANTLQPNTAYTMTLDFSSRFNAPIPANNATPGFASGFYTLGYDRRTTVAFTTGAIVPEPAAAALMGLGILSAACATRKRWLGSVPAV